MRQYGNSQIEVKKVKKNPSFFLHFQDVIILGDKMKIGCPCYKQTLVIGWKQLPYDGSERQQARKKMVSALSPYLCFIVTQKPINVTEVAFTVLLK